VQPVFAGFSILSPSWLWLEMPLMLLLVTLFAWAVSGRRLLRVRRVPAWHSATIGVDGLDSYTAFGYANPTRRVLAGVLHTRAEVQEIMLEDSDQDPGSGPPDRVDAAEGEQAAHLRYASDVMEVVETYLYRPVLRAFLAVVAVAKRLQCGRLDAYLLYMLIALIALIAVVTALALAFRSADQRDGGLISVFMGEPRRPVAIWVIVAGRVPGPPPWRLGAGVLDQLSSIRIRRRSMSRRRCWCRSMGTSLSPPSGL
jgi:hypothetical protein